VYLTGVDQLNRQPRGDIGIKRSSCELKRPLEPYSPIRIIASDGLDGTRYEIIRCRNCSEEIKKYADDYLLSQNDTKCPHCFSEL